MSRCEVRFIESCNDCSSCHANTRGEGEHEAHHDAGKVRADHRIDDDEDMLVAKLFEAVENADGKEVDEDVEVEEKGRPGCGLML